MISYRWLQVNTDQEQSLLVPNCSSMVRAVFSVPSCLSSLLANTSMAVDWYPVLWGFGKHSACEVTKVGVVGPAGNQNYSHPCQSLFCFHAVYYCRKCGEVKNLAFFKLSFKEVSSYLPTGSFCPRNRRWNGYILQALRYHQCLSIQNYSYHTLKTLSPSYT